MFLPVDKEIFVNYMTRLFPNKFTREGLGILFEYLEQSEEQTGTEEEFDPQQIQLTYAESNYRRLTPKLNQSEAPIGEGKKLCSSIDISGHSLKELQQNVKKHIEESGAICIGFTSDKTVIYTRD